MFIGKLVKGFVKVEVGKKIKVMYCIVSYLF